MASKVYDSNIVFIYSSTMREVNTISENKYVLLAAPILLNYYGFYT